MSRDRPDEIKGRRKWHRDAPGLVGRRLTAVREPSVGAKELVGFTTAHAASWPIFLCRSAAEPVGWRLV